MNILLFDTSTSAEIVTVMSGGQIFERTEVSDVSHSRTLFARIESCLNEANITIRDINLLAVGTGPGSFTGIRISVTTARMLAQSLGIEIVGVHSQEIFAMSAPASYGDLILTAFDAKKGRVFGALHLNKEDGLREIVAPGDYDIRHLLDNIGSGTHTICIGDGCERYEEIIHERPGAITIIKQFMPSGKPACLKISEQAASGMLTPVSYHKLLPSYSRKSDAEAAKDSANT